MLASSHLMKAWDIIGTDRFPILRAWRDHAVLSKPLLGLKIYHNTPLSLDAILKIEALSAAGAIVVTSCTGLLIPATFHDARALLQAAGFEFREKKSAYAGEFDFYLDCCAELSRLPPPRFGTVELTRSGVLAYREQAPKYPVISVDDSRIKMLETFHGTGDGFVRAFRELSGRDPKHETFAIVGYGKVGQGVAHWLSRAKATCIIFDNDHHAYRLAQAHGYEAYLCGGTKTASKALEKVTVMVTATGRRNILKEAFPDAEEFLGDMIISNIGAHDEIGGEFKHHHVLADGMAINFTLREPTECRYLDPSFCAHNLCAELLKDRPFADGVNGLPKDVDDRLLSQWLSFHDEPIDFINDSKEMVF